MIINLPDNYDEAVQVLDKLLVDHGLTLHSISVERVLDALAHLSDEQPISCYCQVVEP